MRAAICDDRAEDAQLVAQYVREWGESREESVALEMFPSAEAFLFAYDEDKNFDLLLLDVEMGGMDGVTMARRVRAETALRQAGLGERLKTWERGTETFLFREFDDKGVEVSGGEAQKIAIARALYKDAPFLILDEPTAALDPIAEAEIYEKLNDMVGDKTAIYISHRLSSCKFCDEIVVFDTGKIIQQGAHETLLADESGEYAQLWNAQAQYYR